MPFINFNAEHPWKQGFVKEAINTDFILRGYYDSSTSEPTLHITFEGESSKFYRGAWATDVYQHIHSLPNFIEVPRDETGRAVDLLNLNYALHMFYQDKANSDDSESVLKIEYGMSKEIADQRVSDSTTKRATALTSTARSIVLHGERADEIWNKYQGTAL